MNALEKNALMDRLIAMLYVTPKENWNAAVSDFMRMYPEIDSISIERRE